MNCVCFLIIPFLLLILLYFYCKKCHDYWKNKGVPTFSSKLFFGNVGNALLHKQDIIDNIFDFYTNMKLNGEPFGGYYFFMRPVFVILDLDIIKHILVQDFDHFMDRPTYANDREPLSLNLIAEHGQKWKSLRAKLTPAFTSGKMRMMFDNINAVCDQFTIYVDRKIDNDEALDLNDEIMNVFIDIIGSTGFGIDCNSTGESSKSKFKYYGKKHIHSPSLLQSLLLIISATFPEILTIFKISVHGKEMTNFFIKLVEDIAKYREKNNVVRNDTMQILLQNRNTTKTDEDNLGDAKTQTKNDAGFSINEIAAQCFSFFTAGFGTSSLALSLCIYELSLNDVLQDRAKEEVVSVLKKYNEKITYDAVQEMKYLDMCLHEALRKYPPVVITLRKCTQRYEVPHSSVVLEKGNLVLIPLLSIHMDPEHYPNPEVFDPERFSEVNKTQRHSCSFLAFGQGPRMCIGMKLALLQMKVILAHLLSRYRFSLHHSTEIPVSFSKTVLLYPTSKILINFKKT